MNSTYPTAPRNLRPGDDDIDLTKYLFLFLENWYWFVLAVLVCTGMAYFLNKYATKIYKVKATLLVEADASGYGGYYPSGGLPEGSNVLSGFNLFPGMKNFDNQLLILQSPSQVDTTIHKTGFEVSYYRKEVVGTREVYTNSPFIVSFDKTHLQPLGVTFTVSWTGSGKIRLTAEPDGETIQTYNYLEEKVIADVSAETLNIDTTLGFGDQVKGRNYNFTLLPGKGKTLSGNGDHNTYVFRFNSYQGLLALWQSRISLTQVKTSSSIVELSINTDCPAIATEFLNTHLEMYLKRTLDKKNMFANNTIKFIDEQLLQITDSLGTTETRLQDFRTQNKVVDISIQAQQMYEQTKELEKDRAELKLRADYYRYLKEYLMEGKGSGDIVSPSVMGIADPLLNNIVLELNKLESTKIAMQGSTGSNPYVGTIDSQIRNARATAGETVKNLERNNDLAIRDIDKRLELIMAEVKKLPQKEREFFSIERVFKLNDYIYTYLLQKRSEAQIAKASNTSDNEIIDYARVSGGPIKPKTRMNYILGLFFGILIPGFFLVIKEFLNMKIETEDEVKRITNLPVAGHITHSPKDYQTVVLRDPQANISEAFRNLRTRMKFFTREINSPVILVTSSMPAEGKSFTALNLASAYSLAGNKTVLVGFDLRRPKIYEEFGIHNEKGISTFLIGKDKIDDILIKTDFNNLFVIPAGPVPPNPSELTSTEKTRELFEELKKRFDYIITDSAPIGAVSDTYSLASHSDAVIMLIRHNKTVKNLLKDTLEDCKTNGITNISIVLNDIRNDMRIYGYKGRYGYGHGYGYGYGYGKTGKE